MFLIDWQSRLAQSTAQIRLGIGGRRIGKTQLAVELFKETVRQGGRVQYAIRKTPPRELTVHNSASNKRGRVVHIDSLLGFLDSRLDLLIVDESYFTDRRRYSFQDAVQWYMNRETKVVLVGTPDATLWHDDTLEYRLWNNADGIEVECFGIPSTESPWIPQDKLKRDHALMPFIYWQTQVMGSLMGDVVLMPSVINYPSMVASAYYTSLGFTDLEATDKPTNAQYMQLPKGWSRKRVFDGIAKDMFNVEIRDDKGRHVLTTWFKTSEWDTKSRTFIHVGVRS